ncbi:MAG TPA: histidine kinase dimerization/phospho-acceptor domain-containing protein, partial [Terriglobales bacterium]|nr:histidine kinase dimerization/phospho-acceptor domain-containing protein [Terriglobales bacterium]
MRTAPPGDPGASSGAGDAVGFLLGRGPRFHRDSRRVAAGLVGLALIGVVMLNVALYQRAQSQLVRQRWQQLTDQTQARGDQVQSLMGSLIGGARYVVTQPQTRADLLALSGPQADAARARVEADLGRARDRFGWRAVRVLSAEGAPLAAAMSHEPPRSGRLAALARRASAGSDPVVIEVWRESEASHSLALALPVREAEGGAPVIAVFEARVEDLLTPVLSRWPGFGPTAGGYLVRKEESRIQYLTAPPAGYSLRAGDRVPETIDLAKAAAMAVEGVESSIVLPDGLGHPQAVVTRSLPSLGWGLVGQCAREELLQGISVTLYGLLAFDLALLVLAGAGVWFWRRQYQSGLAQREMEVTRRHGERVQAVFDTAFDAIVTIDRTGHVRTVNRAAQALFGRTAAEVDGQPIHRYLQWGASGRPATELPATGTVVRAEALRADGSVRPVEFALGSSGEGEGLLHSAIVRDITERIESERRIQEFADGLEASNRRLEELNAQLEEASRLKSEFLANTSHELRTPLNGMIGFLQLVLDGLCDSPEEEREFQRQALECSRHLLGLINDVLDIAKIEAGKLSLEITPVDPGTVFDEVYTVTHVQAAQKGIRLAFEPPSDASVRVRGDFGKIKQILINL